MIARGPIRSVLRHASWLLVAAWAVLAASCCLAAQQHFGDITVTVQPQPTPEGTVFQTGKEGYLEFRITVENRSTTKEHEVRLVYPPHMSTFYGDCVTRNARTVRVAPETTSTVSLFQPALQVVDERLAVEINGRRQEGQLSMDNPFNFGYRGYSHPTSGNRVLNVLASRGVPQELKDQVRVAHGDQAGFLRSELPVSEWSPQWLGYTCYDVVLLTREEAESLTADVGRALHRYAESGGMILVHGVPLATAIPETLRNPTDKANHGLYRIGFGILRPCPTKAPWPTEFWEGMNRTQNAPNDPTLQVVGEVKVPVRGLLVLVIAFAVGIGPVNVWFLSRRGRKMWLWWIVPAVSLATCLVVFAYSLASEGVHGHGRTSLVTILDENNHRASTLGFVSYYCPLTPSDGLHFSYDTAVAPLYANDRYADPFRHQRSRTLDWTNDQHLDSGWVMARVPACLALRMNETRRERLSIRRDADGTITVVNGLGEEIESLHYRDADGNFHVAQNLPAGQEAKLDKDDKLAKRAGTVSKSLRELYTQNWSYSLNTLRQYPDTFLVPGTYLAVVKKSPFLNDPLPTAPQEGSVGIIYGICAETGDGR